MEEFAQDQIIDRTKLMPSELERYDGLKQRPEGEGVPDNLKYDPVSGESEDCSEIWPFLISLSYTLIHTCIQHTDVRVAHPFRDGPLPL